MNEKGRIKIKSLTGQINSLVREPAHRCALSKSPSAKCAQPAVRPASWSIAQTIDAAIRSLCGQINGRTTSAFRHRAAVRLQGMREARCRREAAF
jgi:hypothetical protein